MTIIDALKIFIPLLAAIITLIAAYLKFRSRPLKDISEEKLRKKLTELLKSGDRNHNNTKHYWWLAKKLRGIGRERLTAALRDIATSGEGSDGKEVWRLDK